MKYSNRAWLAPYFLYYFLLTLPFLVLLYLFPDQAKSVDSFWINVAVYSTISVFLVCLTVWLSSCAKRLADTPACEMTTVHGTMVIHTPKVDYIKTENREITIANDSVSIDGRLVVSLSDVVGIKYYPLYSPGVVFVGLLCFFAAVLLPRSAVLYYRKDDCVHKTSIGHMTVGEVRRLCRDNGWKCYGPFARISALSEKKRISFEERGDGMVIYNAMAGVSAKRIVRIAFYSWEVLSWGLAVFALAFGRDLYVFSFLMLLAGVCMSAMMLGVTYAQSGIYYLKVSSDCLYCHFPSMDRDERGDVQYTTHLFVDLADIVGVRFVRPSFKTWLKTVLCLFITVLPASVWVFWQEDGIEKEKYIGNMNRADVERLCRSCGVSLEIC